MATSPFTPLRGALGDISNRKLLRSVLKTPLEPPAEEIEAIIGECVLPDIDPLKLYEFSSCKSPLREYRETLFEELEFPIESQEFFDESFQATEQEIERYLEAGVKYNGINIVD